MADTSDFGRLLAFLPDPLFVVDLQGRIETANPAATALLGTDVAGAALGDYLEEEPARLAAYLKRCSGSGSPLLGSLRVRTPSGARKVQVQGARFAQGAATGGAAMGAGTTGGGTTGGGTQVVLRIRAEAGTEFSVLGQKVEELNREVRQRRRTQAALEEALRHKETLLQELHHRVKNHTQMLLGMLSLAARESASDEIRDVIGGIRARLLAIGAAQQLMYQAGQIDALPARDFLGALCRALCEAWPEAVVVSFETDELELRNDVTTSLALIVNELAVNALKHGLGGVGPGEIRVTLRRVGADAVLTVWNSGDDWVESDDGRRSSGLSLVRGLCRQIGGAFDIRRDEGTSCTVKFPYHLPERTAG